MIIKNGVGKEMAKIKKFPQYITIKISPIQTGLILNPSDLISPTFPLTHDSKAMPSSFHPQTLLSFKNCESLCSGSWFLTFLYSEQWKIELEKTFSPKPLIPK